MGIKIVDKLWRKMKRKKAKNSCENGLTYVEFYCSIIRVSSAQQQTRRKQMNFENKIVTIKPVDSL